MSSKRDADGSRSPSLRPTQKHVAEAAGVSQAAVSIVLNDPATPAVPPATRERIQQAARVLGYVPNRTAQLLRAARSMTLACVVPDITNPFYPGLVRGRAGGAARGSGYDVLIYDTDGAAEGERRALDWMLRGRADGIVGTFFHLRASDLAELVRHRIAVVRLENRQRPVGDVAIDNLFIDNSAAAAEMTRLLISRGHRRIALITGKLGPGQQRADGYTVAMADAGLTADIVMDEEFSEAGGRRCMNARAAPQAPGDRRVRDQRPAGDRRDGGDPRGRPPHPGRYRRRRLRRHPGGETADACAYHNPSTRPESRSPRGKDPDWPPERLQAGRARNNTEFPFEIKLRASI